MSSSLVPYVENVDISTGTFSDHSIISMDIDFTRFIRGRGFWKLNTSLLKDREYVKMVNNIIKRVACQYAIINNDPNFYTKASIEDIEEFLCNQTPESFATLEYTINPQLLLEMILLEIRRETIKLSMQKKKQRILKEQLLYQEIEALERRIGESNDSNFATLDEECQQKKLELEELLAYQAEGAFVRTRMKEKVEGEKPTKLFCALEKHNSVQKYISKLNVVKNGSLITTTNQKEIEGETLTFYKDLFGNKDKFLDEIKIEDFLGEDIATICPKISEKQKTSMEGEISTSELGWYLKKSKNNVAPGSTGFPNEFYKMFWKDLKFFILDSINFSLTSGTLSISQRLGIVTLIPKGSKDKTYLSNWRPLTLLNSIYKMVGGVIAQRIKPVLKTIINADQKGFVSERYIGEAIRCTYDIMHWANEKKKVGLILLIDFQKAYDSVSFSFIEKCLRFFNFGKDVINWVNILLNNFSCVMNMCGNISSKFDIGRGCRQGDPIASFLFIICIEILAIKLRSDKLINGFKIGNLVHLLEMYADDCSIFLNPTDVNLRYTVSVLDHFFKISGLKISISKTKAIWFGAGSHYDHKLCPDLPLGWDNEFKLLGIDFDNRLLKMERNYANKVEEVKKLLNCWMYRALTPYGKITVIKSLALSKLSHAALVIPSLNNKQLRELESIFFSFLWNRKPDVVARESCKLKEKAGGLRLVDIKDFWRAFKFSWIRRLTRLGCLDVTAILS